MTVQETAKTERGRLNLYQDLTYYGFLTRLSAYTLFKKFEAAGAAPLGASDLFPCYLDPKYRPVHTWMETYHELQALHARLDWPFYDQASAQSRQVYWGLDRADGLKAAYEIHLGVGSFLGLLFSEDNAHASSKREILPAVYLEAKKKVAKSCWDKRVLWWSCLQCGLIQDKAWLYSLLFNSLLLMEPEYTGTQVYDAINNLSNEGLITDKMFLIRFLNEIRVQNESLFETLGRKPLSYPHYRKMVLENKSFLQAKVSIENFFNREKLAGPRAGF